MAFYKGRVLGAGCLDLKEFRDHRGVFCETYSEAPVPQVNVSVSLPSVLRGLHGDADIAKYVTCVSGVIYDVVADTRPGSPTYGEWDAWILGESRWQRVYVPKGCAHGFVVVSSTPAVVQYSQTVRYSKANEFGVHWRDPLFNIGWPVAYPLLSEKDSAHKFLPDDREDGCPND